MFKLRSKRGKVKKKSHRSYKNSLFYFITRKRYEDFTYISKRNSMIAVAYQTQTYLDLTCEKKTYYCHLLTYYLHYDMMKVGRKLLLNMLSRTLQKQELHSQTPGHTPLLIKNVDLNIQKGICTIL